MFPKPETTGRRHRTLQAMQTGARQAEEGGLPRFCPHGFLSKQSAQDFPDGPVVGTLPSNAGGVGSSSVWRAKIPHASWPKNQNIKRKRYHFTHSIKALKTVGIKEIFKNGVRGKNEAGAGVGERNRA